MWQKSAEQTKQLHWNFIDAGDIDKEVPVEDYVLFDIMEEADK